MSTHEQSNPSVTTHHHSETTCPECEGQVTTTGSERVCTECGLVLHDDRLDRGPEWRAFDTEQRVRTGAPLTATRHDRGLSTEIGYHCDGNGTSLSPRKRRQLGRLRREQRRGRFQSKAERNQAHGLTEVRRLTSALDLPDSLRERAAMLFRRAHEKGLAHGRSLDALAAASVYGSCRCNGLARPSTEIATYARCSPDTVDHVYSVLNTECNLPTSPPSPAAFIPRFATTLDVSAPVRQRALTLTQQAEAAGLIGGAQPSGFAAACLYKAAREHDASLTQSTIAEVAETSTATIRTHRDRLNEWFDES